MYTTFRGSYESMWNKKGVGKVVCCFCLVFVVVVVVGDLWRKREGGLWLEEGGSHPLSLLHVQQNTIPNILREQFGFFARRGVDASQGCGVFIR